MFFPSYHIHGEHESVPPQTEKLGKSAQDQLMTLLPTSGTGSYRCISTYYFIIFRIDFYMTFFFPLVLNGTYVVVCVIMYWGRNIL